MKVIRESLRALVQRYYELEHVDKQVCPVRRVQIGAIIQVLRATESIPDQGSELSNIRVNCERVFVILGFSLVIVVGLIFEVVDVDLWICRSVDHPMQLCNVLCCRTTTKCENVGRLVLGCIDADFGK